MADSRERTDTYTAGLAMLARRELSEAQLRQRLRRRQHAPDQIDTAIARLKQERALDDARAAEAIARTQIRLRGRGRGRVDRQIRQAGIDATVADQALDRAYADVDADDLLAAALEKRLKGHSRITDHKQIQRLYRYLVGQGFDSERVLGLLRTKM